MSSNVKIQLLSPLSLIGSGILLPNPIGGSSAPILFHFYNAITTSLLIHFRTPLSNSYGRITRCVFYTFHFLYSKFLFRSFCSSFVLHEQPYILCSTWLFFPSVNPSLRLCCFFWTIFPEYYQTECNCLFLDFFFHFFLPLMVLSLLK